MAAKRTKTRYQGVYVRETDKGVKVFDITYRRGGKKLWEKVGPEPDYSAALASKILGKRLKEVWHGEELPRDRKAVPTFGDVADKYLKWSKAHKKSHADDDTRYKMHLKERLSGKQVDMIRPLDLERLKAEMKEEGKAPATIRQALALFRGIFNKGKAWGQIRAENPMKAVKMPKVDNARERFLSVEELHLLLSTLQKRSPQAYELAVMSLNTGARWSEVTGLTWGDVDLNARVVTFKGTKNGRTRRIMLNAQGYDLLKGKVSGTAPQKPSEAVFQTGDGQPIRNITSAFQRVADELFNRDLAAEDKQFLSFLARSLKVHQKDLLGLTWGDVNLAGGKITVREKKRGGVRVLSLSPQATAALSKRESKNREERVFKTADGKPVDFVSDRRQKVVFHTLRHTAASHMVMEGVPLATVKEILGHSSLAMVERYSHLTRDHVGEAVAMLGRKIQKVENGKVVSIPG